MHTYKLHTQNTLKVCHHEIGARVGPLRLIRKYWLPYNQILKLTQHFTKEGQLHYSILWNYETKFEVVIYYSLHVDSSWIGVRNLTRECYQSIKITFKILELQISLLCDQIAYSSSKEHMLNSTKGITVTIDFVITHALWITEWDMLSQSYEILWCLY